MGLLVKASLTRLAACMLVLGVVVCPTLADMEQTADSVLPPEEMVVELRASRLEEMRGDLDEGLRLLRELAEAYPQSLVPVMALWDFHSRHELPTDETLRLRDLLTRRLGDPDRAKAQIAGQ